MEVAVARVYNWDVVRKRKEKEEEEKKGKKGIKADENEEPNG
jgi:translation elongation factor EF-4